MADLSQLPTLTHSGARRLLRRLELEAYASVVSAFRAQGQLSREKKASLELVAKCLGISAERHRAEIRRAVNDEVLGQVASSISGVETEKAWRHEGKKLLSSLPPRLVSHQHPSLLPQTLTAITTATHKLKASLGNHNIATEARKVPTPIQNALRVILSHVPLKSEQPQATAHPGSIKSLPPQRIPSSGTQKSLQKNVVIKEEVTEPHPSPSKAATEQGKVYSQLESLLCEEQLMLVKGGGRKGGPSRLEANRLEGRDGGHKSEKEKKDGEERTGERKDEGSVVGMSDGGGGVGVNNDGGSGEDNMVVNEEGVSSTGGRGGGKPLPTLSETRKRQLSPVPPKDLPPIKKQLPLSGSSSQDNTLSQTAPRTAEAQLNNKATPITTIASSVSLTTPVIVPTLDETIPSEEKLPCTVETVNPTKHTSHAILATTQSQATLARSESMDICYKASLETSTVINPSISSVTIAVSSLPVEHTMPTPASVASSSLPPHSHTSTPPHSHPSTPLPPHSSSSNTLPATTKPQELLPATTPQLQQVLPAIPSQLQQLLPTTRPPHAVPPEPQNLHTITPPLQQVSQPHKTLPEIPAYQLPSVIVPRPSFPSTSSQELFPTTSTPLIPLESSLPTPAKEEAKVFRAKSIPAAEAGAIPDTLSIRDIIQDTSDSAVLSLASQLGLENAPLLNLDFMSFFQPNAEDQTYTSSDSMSAFTLPPLNVDPPAAVPNSCSSLDVTSTAPKHPRSPAFSILFDTADSGSCPSSIDDPLPICSDSLHGSTAESKPSSLPLDKVKPTLLADGTTLITAEETAPSVSGKPADLVSPSSVEYLDLTDIGSLMGTADASKLLEGIPEDMAKSIQTIVQLDEQTWN